MRLFVGVELDADVRAGVASVASDLRRQVDALLRPGPDLRWVEPANLHITLWFIGHVDDARGAAIRRALEHPFTTTPFDLPVSGCGMFPRSGPPRVVWIGTQAAAEMSRLYAEVRDRLVPLGFEAEKRPFTGHVTIARVRENRSRGLPRRRAGQADDLRVLIERTPGVCGVSRVNAVTLFLSRLSPKGAAYEPLLRVPLGSIG
jgi:2'-5' RNA ligase